MAEKLPQTLPELRDAINEVDEALVSLLRRRSAISLAVGEIKRSGVESEVFRPGREAAHLQTLLGMDLGPLPPEHLKAVYREIFSSSRTLQRPLRVAFLGPEGTFSHMAGRELFGSLTHFQPQKNFKAVFRAVEEEGCDLGIIPLENSLQGSVGQNFDLFAQHPLYIRAEMYSRIRHSLLSREKEMAAIRVVYSHSQPLAQCAARLAADLPRARIVPMESTAAAAHRAADGEAGAAAIAHGDLASALGLNVLIKSMEDAPNNWTRFVVIGRTPADRPGPDKSSILFAAADKPGSLSSVLQCFASAGVNLRKLESRPVPGENWKYIFFADLECDIYDDTYADLREELAQHCLSLRLLGSYPSGALL